MFYCLEVYKELFIIEGLIVRLLSFVLKVLRLCDFGKFIKFLWVLVLLLFFKILENRFLSYFLIINVMGMKYRYVKNKYYLFI